MDISNITGSFDTPIAKHSSRLGMSSTGNTLKVNSAATRTSEFNEEIEEAEENSITGRNASNENASANETQLQADTEEDATVVLPKPPVSPPVSTPLHASSTPIEDASVSVIEIEPNNSPIPVSNTLPSEKKQKIRITSDVEQIAVCCFRFRTYIIPDSSTD
jgi:hypothetical protein